MADGLADADNPQAGVVHLRALVVDGNVDIAESIAMYLRLEGHESRVALTGGDAYRIASAFQPQLVLVEVWLPDIDGYEVIRRLRALPQTARSTLVAITDQGDFEAREYATACGCDAHLVKPFDPDRLRSIADGVVRRRH